MSGSSRRMNSRIIRRPLKGEHFLASGPSHSRGICYLFKYPARRVRVNNKGITETSVLILDPSRSTGLTLYRSRAMFASDFLSSSERTDIIPIHPLRASLCEAVLPRTTVICGRLIRAAPRVRRDAWRKNIDAVTYERRCWLTREQKAN